MTTKSALRILVALDNSPASLAAAEAGAQLAAALGAEISGLFVEDDRLLGLGHLAITREFDPLTATTRDVVREDLERQLRALAARARKFLARLAEGRAPPGASGWPAARCATRSAPTPQRPIS